MDNKKSWIRCLPGFTLFDTSDTVDESPYSISLKNFRIEGGWVKDWNDTVAAATTYSAIEIRGDSGGPDDPVAKAREDRNSFNDPHHVIEGLQIRRFRGNGIRIAGRGEIHVTNNHMGSLQGYGLSMNSPDNWIMHNTCSTTGLSGCYITEGNQRSVANKWWYCGMLEDTDNANVGAGIEFSGAANTNITSIGDATQDTFGPGVSLEGKGIIMTGLNIDEAGGGRLEFQNFKGPATRSQERCFIGVDNAEQCRIQGSVVGGKLGDGSQGEMPYLVEFRNSGAMGNRIEMTSSDDNTGIRDEFIDAVGGYTSNKRQDVVMLNDRMVFGHRTAAELADAAHGVNDASGPTTVYLDDGRVACKLADGTWVPSTLNTAIAPV